MNYVLLEDLHAYGQVTTRSDDPFLISCIEWAEGMFESLTGSAFARATVTDEIALNCVVDAKGMLWLTAHSRAPVVSISSLKVRYRNLAYQTITWASDDIILPRTTITSRMPPEAWTVRLWPSPTLAQQASDELTARWTYVAGFQTIPDPLKNIILRMAWMRYKLREAPLTRITLPPFGSIEVPSGMTEDILTDVALWRRNMV